MAFDIEMIRKVYKKYPEAVEMLEKQLTNHLLWRENTIHSSMEWNDNKILMLEEKTM